MDLSRHAEDVEALWSAYGRGQNARVPITFACDEQVWLKVAGGRFREFYTDPDVHLRVQLEGQRWFREHIIGDMPPGPPETWQVGLQLWMEENAFFGAEIVYQDDDYAWGLPLSLGREDWPAYLGDLDPMERVRGGQAFGMYQALAERADGMTFDDRPVQIVPPSGTHGIFTKAAEIRGIEQLCLDLYEAPDFAETFLRLVTDKTIARLQAWHELAYGRPREPSPDRFLICDDSLQLISPEQYERFVLPCHERLYAAMTTGRRAMHLCGYAMQHYATMRRKLNVTLIDGPGPFVEHGRYLRELGPDFAFNAEADNSVMLTGPDEAIRAMMRGLLSPAAKIPGRFQVMGFVTRDMPLDNVRVCYEAGREYGVIP